MFQGQPSPSLRAMQQMTRPQLVEHLRKLDEQARLNEAKLQRLRRHEPTTRDKIKRLQHEQDRLRALIQEARRLHAVASD